MKKILIAGSNSYIGDSCKRYLDQYPEQYTTCVLDTMGLDPSPEHFASYDVVFCVAGIAHMRETSQNRHLYYDVNRDLVVKIARAAKQAGVRQFILLSSMSVYGMETGYITKDTVPDPSSAYGKSKLQADQFIWKLADSNFRFVCLRPPMVYGKGCKGNYQTLRRFALKSPLFPDYNNQRSMVYIDNLCEFIRCCIDFEKSGLFFPQNAEYTNTADMVRIIARENGKSIRMISGFNFAIRLLPLRIFRKVFGSLTYEKTDTVGKYDFEMSLIITETK